MTELDDLEMSWCPDKVGRRQPLTKQKSRAVQVASSLTKAHNLRKRGLGGRRRVTPVTIKRFSFEEP